MRTGDNGEPDPALSARIVAPRGTDEARGEGGAPCLSRTPVSMLTRRSSTL